MLKRVAAGVGVNIFDKLVVAGVQLGVVPILVTHWGVSKYGLWLLLATIPQFLAVGDFGFATAAGTKMAMAAARNERDEVIHIFQSAWRAILISSACLITVVLLGAWLAPISMFGANLDMPANDVRATLSILMIYGIVAIQGSIFFAAFRAAQLFPVGAFWNALILLIENGALIVTVLMGGSPMAAATAWLLGRMAGLVGQNILLRRMVPWLKIGLRKGSWDEVRALLPPAGAVMLLPLAQAAALQGTSLALGIAAGRAAIPAFNAVRTISRVGLQMCWLINTPLMPEFSGAVARGDRRGMSLMVLSTLLFSAVLVVPYAIGFTALGSFVLRIWTHGLIVAPPGLIPVMGLTILFGGFWYPLSNLILACNQHRRYTTWYVGFAVASMPVSFLLARLMGATGAAIATATLDGAMFLVIAGLSLKILSTRRELADALPDLGGRLAHVARKLRRA